MKKSIITTLLLTLLLVGIASASKNPGFVWIDTSYPCTVVGNACVPANVFSEGQQIYLPVGFFAPDADGWEVNWIISDKDGSMIYVNYVTFQMTAQTYAVKGDTVSLPAGTYTFTAAAIGRGVGKGAVSKQYGFTVTSPSSLVTPPTQNLNGTYSLASFYLQCSNGLILTPQDVTFSGTLKLNNGLASESLVIGQITESVGGTYTVTYTKGTSEGFVNVTSSGETFQAAFVIDGDYLTISAGITDMNGGTTCQQWDTWKKISDAV